MSDIKQISFLDKLYDDMTLYEFTLIHYPTHYKKFFEDNLEEIKKISDSIDYKIAIYPPRHQIYNIFYSIPLKDIKCIILGQDPYHNKGSAMGYAFSLHPDVKKINPSLKNIFKIVVESGFKINSKNGDLTSWVKQGVFLLNTALTVEEKNPDSHTSLWSNFTINFLKYVAENIKGIVFLLWGSRAHSYEEYIDKDNNIIIKSSHPAPNGFAAGKMPFKDSVCFLRANKALEKLGKTKINWNLE